MKKSIIMLAIVAILTIFIAPNPSHAFGFHGMSGDCPILFDVRFGDPAEFVIKKISQQTETNSYKSKVLESGNTEIVWEVNNPRASREVVMALFDEKMRLVGLSNLIKTYEVEYIDELFTSMMKSVGNVEGTRMEGKKLGESHYQLMSVCKDRLGYDFEIETMQTKYGNTVVVASVLMLSFK